MPNKNNTNLLNSIESLKKRNKEIKKEQQKAREEVIEIINDWSKVECSDGKEKCHECVNDLKEVIKNSWRKE